MFDVFGCDIQYNWIDGGSGLFQNHSQSLYNILSRLTWTVDRSMMVQYGEVCVGALRPLGLGFGLALI